MTEKRLHIVIDDAGLKNLRPTAQFNGGVSCTSCAICVLQMKKAYSLINGIATK